MKTRIIQLVLLVLLGFFQTVFGQTVLTSTSSITDFGDIVQNNYSPEQSYVVSGTDLTSDINITSPSGFEISLTSGSGFSNSIIVPQSSGTVTSTIIYVRFNPTLIQVYTGNITNSSTGAASQNVGVSGTGVAATLTATPSNRAVTNPSGTTTFDVTSNISWTVSETTSWLSVGSPTGSNNGTINVSYDENTTTSQRVGTITLSGNGVSDVPLTVTQDAGSAVLTATPSNRAVTNPSGTTTFDVTSNISWTVSETTSWLSVGSPTGSNNGTINVSYDENTTTSQRVGTITLSGNGVSDVPLTVTQDAGSAVLTATPSNRAVTNPSGTTTFDVTSNISWTVSETTSWLSVGSPTGSNNGTINVSYDENTTTSQRVGTITLSGNGVSDVPLTVTQDAGSAVLTATPSNRAVTNPSGTTTFDVTSNISWTVSETTSWLSVGSPTGSNNGTINVSYDENTTTSQRVGTITLSGNGVSDVPLTVTQDAGSAVLTATPSNQNVANSSGSTTFSITSNTSWNTTDNATWLTLSTASGSGDATLTASYSANPTIVQRVATITITDGSISREVTVTQAAGAAVLTATPSNRDVANNSGSTTFSITSNTSWNITDNATWLTLSTASGSGDETLTASYSANPTIVQRVATITITDGSISREVTVTQAAGAAVLTATPSNRDVANNSGSTTFSITSNTSWNITDNATWLTLSTASGSGDATLTASYSANPTIVQRVATITITDGSISREVTVTQAAGAAVLTATPSNRDVANNSGSTTFSITSNTTWNITDNATWLTLSTASGSGDATLTASYSTNPTIVQRVATITITDGSISREVTVTQAAGAAVLTVTPSNRDVANSSGSTTFSITSNTTWNITDNATWLTLSTASGSGDATLTASYSANPTIIQRVATITITEGSISREVTVTQTAGAAVLTVTPSNRDVANSSGSTTFSITSNTSWNITDNATWLTLSTASGSGDATLTASYSANPTIVQRVATITITDGSISREVTVTQAAGAAVLTATPSNRDVANNSGSTTFSITSNTSWNITDNATWLTLSTASGSGDATLTASYSANPTTVQRVAIITITDGAISREVTVTQAQTNQLDITPTNQLVLNTSGSTTFEITSNVNWTVSDNVNWLSVSPTVTSGNKTLTATYTGNPSTTQRIGIISITGGGISKNVTVTQEPKYIISAITSPTEGGTISGTGNFFDGEVVSLVATAATGYTFVNWTESGVVKSTNSTYSFTALEDRSLTANFSLNNYTLAVTIQPPNSGTVIGDGTYPYGTTASLEAFPAVGYTFLNWGGDISATDNPENIVIDSDKNVTANFQLNSYSITTTSNPFDGGTTSGGGTFDHGSQVTLVATSGTGYRFVNWTLNGNQVSLDSTYIFNAENAGAYTANFVLKKYSVSTTPIPTEGGTVTGNGVYDHGTMVNIIATPNYGWEFDNWTEGNSALSIDSIYSFPLLESRSFNANFSKKIYSLITNSLPVEAGTTTGDDNYEHGTNVIITAFPNIGWRFVNWTENGAVVFTDSLKTFDILKSRTITANYVKKIYSISANSSPSIGGIIKGDSNYTHGDLVTLTAVANIDSGYEFVNWTENGFIVSSNSIYSFTAESKRELIANFKLKTYSVTFSTNPANSGNPSGDGIFTHGDSVTINANPAPGWLFANWSENNEIVSDLTSYTFRITKNRTITANFANVLYSISGIPDPIDAGFVSGTGTAYYDQIVTLTANPRIGWEFNHWEEGSVIVSNLPAYQFAVKENRDLVAVFTLKNYSITCSAEPLIGGRTNGCGLSHYDQDMTVSAIPNSGYKFINWTENGNIVSTSADYKFKVERDRDLVANFDFSTDLERLDNSDIIPENYYLSNAYPNPFNPETNIQFGLPEPSETSITIFDVNGQVVSYLLDKVLLSAGNYSKKFKAINITSGIYFYRIFTQASGSDKHFVKVGKLVLVK